MICLLFGFFAGSVISTSAGQRAELDVVVAFFLLVITEVISRFVYGVDRVRRRSLPAEVANALKLGVIYSLFLEAFKLGS